MYYIYTISSSSKSPKRNVSMLISSASPLEALFFKEIKPEKKFLKIWVCKQFSVLISSVTKLTE